MKSINFVFSSGATIFLLLVVGSTHGDKLPHGSTACKFPPATPPVPAVAPETYTCQDIFECHKTGPLPLAPGVTAAAVGTAGAKDTHSAKVTAETDTGICVCKTLDHGYDTGDKTCKVPSTAPPPDPDLPNDAKNTKNHGEDCVGPTAENPCKEGSVCSVGTAAVAATDGTTEDTPGTHVWGTEADADKKKKGKCVCTAATPIFKGGKCDAKPTPATPAKHNADCAPPLKPCEDIFQCTVDGTVGSADKGDELKTDYVAGGKDGKCLCKDKKTHKDGKCVEPMKKVDDNTTVPPGPDNAKAGSGRIVYQPLSLLLISIAAMGSRLVLWSS